MERLHDDPHKGRAVQKDITMSHIKRT